MPRGSEPLRNGSASVYEESLLIGCDQSQEGVNTQRARENVLPWHLDYSE